jgi:hypothetical protein
MPLDTSDTDRDKTQALVSPPRQGDSEKDAGNLVTPGEAHRPGKTTMMLRAAREAVERLDVKSFIQTHLTEIFDKLEECEGYARNELVNGDMMFMAFSLPVINGVIHIASNRRDLREASSWVVENWEGGEDADQVSILSALTLIYVVGEGYETYVKKYAENPTDSPETRKEKLGKRDIWERIYGRVRKLSLEMQ